jgi:hypothetical protein
LSSPGSVSEYVRWSIHDDDFNGDADQPGRDTNCDDALIDETTLYPTTTAGAFSNTIDARFRLSCDSSGNVVGASGSSREKTAEVYAWIEGNLGNDLRSGAPIFVTCAGPVTTRATDGGGGTPVG